AIARALSFSTVHRMAHQAQRSFADARERVGCYPTSGPPSNRLYGRLSSVSPPGSLARRMPMRKVDPQLEALRQATLWRCYARRQVEEEMRRRGEKPLSITFAQLQERITQWVAAHPRPQ